MARRKRGAANAAAPGSLFVWVQTPTGRQLMSRRLAEVEGLTVGPARVVAADSDEETAADERSESVLEIEVEADAPATKPMTSRRSGSRRVVAQYQPNRRSRP